MAEVDLATLAVRVKSEGADKATKDLGDLGKQATETESRTDKLSESTARLVTRFVSFAAVAGTATAALRASVAQYTDLQAATANLTAKTGLAGEALGVMVERAQQLAGATTQSATAILYAAEQVEGMVPALGGNAEAIAEVTRQAVILAEATGDELEPSVVAVGQALQQFGGDATAAARYANALVAAAQVGAAEVQDLSGALERIGPAADRAGVSFEQTLATMELLANRGIKGRDAVGGLKEFFDKLSSSTVTEYNPALVGLDQALANLAAANLSAAERTKLFGDAAADVAGVILGNVDTYRDLADKITGTSAATDQATQRLQTFEAQSKILNNELAALGVEVGSVLVPYLTSLTREASGVARALADLSDEAGNAEGSVDAFGGVLRAAAVAGLAFTNTLGLAVRTAATLAGTLPDAVRGITQPLELFKAYDAAAAKIGADFESTVDRIEKARERLTTPDDPLASPLTARAPDAAAGGDAKGDAAKREAERRAAAESEGAAAQIEERQKFTAQYLDYLEQFGDDTYKVLSKQSQEQAELQIEGDLARWQSEVELEERKREWRKDRHAELAEAMKSWFETDLEATLEQYEAREAAIEEFFKGVTYPAEEERAEALRKLHAQKEAEITELFRRGAFTRAQFEVATAKQKTAGVLGELENMTRGIAQHNKAAFQVNKAAAIAEALIAMPEHVSKTMAKYPFPLSVAMGALAAASSLAQINAIRSTTFEGGGGGTTPSLAGSGGVVNGNPAQPDTAPPPDIGSARGQGSQMQIVIAGNTVMDDYAMERFIERIGEVVNERDVNIFKGNSRQAQDIVITQR